MDAEQENGIENHEAEVGEWPLWKICLRKMRSEEQYGYGAIWPTEFFEKHLTSDRATLDFAFQMLSLRKEIEDEDGYYLQAQTIEDEITKVKSEQYVIPAANYHEDISQHFESRMRRYANRAVGLRNATLCNPTAKLDDDVRKKMEARLEIAATRLVLLARESSIGRWVKNHAPKLLKK
jgi:hypothetical protein